MPTRDAGQIKANLMAERGKLLAVVDEVAREDMLRAPAGGSWSIKDILAHLAMAESLNVRFAQMMVSKDAPEQLVEFKREYPDYPGEFELDRFNAWMTERGRRMSLEEAVTAVNAERAKTLAWLETLTPEQLERRGKHAVWGDQTVRSMFRILVLHDRLHRGDIEKIKASRQVNT